MRRRSASERRLQVPEGWTSKGEVIRETPDPYTGKPVPVRTPVYVNGGTPIMPKKETQPTEEIVARGDTEVALKLGGGTTRDALVDPREGDYIPDNEEKGYHVGETRQPAEPVLTSRGDVRFESTSDLPSKFEGNDARSQKERSNAREQEQADLYGGSVHVAPSVNASDVVGVGGRERLRAQGFEVKDDPKAEG